MAESTDDIAASLNAFVAKDDGSDPATLYELLDGVDLSTASDRLLPAMFGVMERYPEADLGAPGPLVRLIETLPVPEFEPALRSSVRRQPGQLNVWMVNRILNSTPSAEHRRELLALLKAVTSHPRASAASRAMAERLLQHHAARQAR